MAQIELTTLTSLLAATAMLTLFLGYFRALITSHGGVVFHLVLSICLVYVAYVSRTVYWDIAWFHKQTLSVEMSSINILFDCFAIWGGVHGHIALYKMIPDDERNRWCVLTAWLYPPFKTIHCFKCFVNWIMKWRS